MIFPLPSIWFDSPTDDHVASRVDRFEDAKRHRMAIGLHLDDEFDDLHGSLLIVSGHGKYLRACSWSTDTITLDQSLQNLLKDLFQLDSPSLSDVCAVKSELAGLQSQLVFRLKEKAGKYVDRVLAVCVSDPGLWLKDFDERPIYQSLCDPTKLADLTGLNVIDAFPSHDVANGGQALKLAALPIWLMYADRDQREATKSRIVVLHENQSEGFFLPGSDGLDAELPSIQAANFSGGKLFEKLASAAGLSDQEKLLQQVTLNGKSCESLLDCWQEAESREGTIDELRAIASSYDTIQALRSCVVFTAEQIAKWHQRLPKSLPINQVSIAGNSAFSTLLTNELRNRLGQSDSISVHHLGVGNDELNATLAAMLGFLTIDQMPASLPWLTGCDQPQVLGRITQGRPSSWRQLLIEMADYRPPVMKLKDAV